VTEHGEWKERIGWPARRGAKFRRGRAGTVWVNSYRTLSFNTPFGGYKASGLGRENGLDSVYEYTQTKAVWIELSGKTRDPFTLG